MTLFDLWWAMVIANWNFAVAFFPYWLAILVFGFLVYAVRGLFK